MSKEIMTKIHCELGYDSDLVVDENDRVNLNKMNEIDRELILDQRRTKREQLLQRYALLKQKQSEM